MQRAQASLSLITLMPRFLCGLSPRHAWCAVVGNFLHWLLALYQVGFQLNSSTFAAQSLEFGIVVAGILAVRRQMYINVRTNLDLKTRIFSAICVMVCLESSGAGETRSQVAAFPVTRDSVPQRQQLERCLCQRLFIFPVSFAILHHPSTDSPSSSFSSSSSL